MQESCGKNCEFVCGIRKTHNFLLKKIYNNLYSSNKNKICLKETYFISYDFIRYICVDAHLGKKAQ